MTTTVWHTPPQGVDHLRTRLYSKLFHRFLRAKEFASGPGILVMCTSTICMPRPLLALAVVLGM